MEKSFTFFVELVVIAHT